MWDVWSWEEMWFLKYRWGLDRSMMEMSTGGRNKGEKEEEKEKEEDQPGMHFR